MVPIFCWVIRQSKRTPSLEWGIYFVKPPHLCDATASFKIYALGQEDDVGEQAVDTIWGRIVNVDIDVDSDYDGDIDDADEPLEETPGGFVGAGAENLTPISLSFGPPLAQLPGKLKLSATKGENHIRLWRDAQRSDQVALPTVWQNPSQMPTTLYVEGVTPSANVRDVELALEYDENPHGQNNPHFKCADKIALTVIKVVIDKIAFNYNPASTSCDAMNIRQNFTTPITAPEYINGLQNEPVAYVKGQPVNILVRVCMEPKDIPCLTIKGISDDINGSLDSTSAKDVYFVNGVSKEGSDNPATSEFDESDFVQFAVEGTTTNVVYKSDETWKWTVVGFGGTVSPMFTLPVGITSHTVYVIYSVSERPWTQVIDHHENPWVTALNFAIDICGTKGCSSEDDIAELITRHLYEIKYTPESQYYENGVFDYTKYMRGTHANCLDSALGLDATCSVLGLDIYAVKRTKIFSYNYHCFTRKGGYVYDSTNAMKPTAIIKVIYEDYLQSGTPGQDSEEFVLRFILK